MKYVVASASKEFKGEDATLVQTRGDFVYGLVCDGHGGKDAAKLVVTEFMKTLDDADMCFVRIFQTLHTLVQAKCNTCGCTLSVFMWNASNCDVIHANCGDSDIVVFEPTTYNILSETHRLQYNARERQRLQEAGAVVRQARNEIGEPYGPYRLWPGGLAVSRSIGDADCPYISCQPFVSRCVLRNAVIVIASDGVWDTFPIHRVRDIVTRHTVQEAAKLLCNKGDLTDDRSAIVIQIGNMIVQNKSTLFFRSPSHSSSLSDEDEDEIILRVSV